MQLGIFVIINLSILIGIVTGQTSQDLSYSVCSCDLLSEVCDLNCCCDSACSEFDKAAFRCPTNEVANTNKWCVPDSMLFFQNTPYIVKSLEGLMCIDINNCKYSEYRIKNEMA